VVFYNFQTLLRNLRNVNRNAALQRKVKKIATFFTTGRWEMLLKAVGQLLGTAKWVQEATWKCPMVIKKPLGISYRV
jgi:hypothetical protein